MTFRSLSTSPVPVILFGIIACQACASLPGSQAPERQSKPETFNAEEGIYLAGMLGIGNISDEDFDGTSFVSGGGSSEIMPKLDQGSGVGWAIGVRTGRGSMEFNYVGLDHDSEWVGIGIDSTTRSYNLDCRVHFRPETRFQPHILFGVGLASLTVEDGSVGSSGGSDDAVFHGLTACLGGGASYHVTRHFSVGVDLGRRFTSYSRVDGIVDGDLEDNASGSGVFGALRVQYTF